MSALNSATREGWRPETAALADLRSYRRRLCAEEVRISYWRRLIQARLDLLLVEAPVEDASVSAGPDERTRAGLRATLHSRLLRLLTDPSAARRGRTAALRVAPPEHDEQDAPLPGLRELWYEPACDDPAGRAEQLARLCDAERLLSQRRNQLHRRIDDATAELVRRYRETPDACLVALPAPGTPDTPAQ